MNDRYFLDTNIFVYCFDRTSRAKQKRAEQLVGQALQDHRGLISSHVVQEFLNVATRKFAAPMSSAEARIYLETVLAPLCEVFPSLALYGRALEVQAFTNYCFYDALIIAGALEAQCRWLLSEDLQPGQALNGLTIQNPFCS